MEYGKHRGDRIDSVNGFDIIECTTCGFRHVVPLPSDEELGDYYAKQFYEERLFIPEKFETDREWLEMCYAERYEVFENFLQTGRHRLLEIGSGIGGFLEVGVQRGWDVVGVEPSARATQLAQSKGLKVVNDLFSKEKVAHLGPFDVVHMDDVMEHLTDPVETLHQIRSFLSEKGLISLICPNDYSPLQSLLRDHQDFSPWWLSPPIHLNYFNFKSMTALLEKTGFEVVETTTSFPMEFFLIAGDNYVKQSELGGACHDRRKAFEVNLNRYGMDPLRRKLYSALASEGVGRHIVMVARKL